MRKKEIIRIHLESTAGLYYSSTLQEKIWSISSKNPDDDNETIKNRYLDLVDMTNAVIDEYCGY